MGNATNANYIGNVVNTAGTTFSYDVADEAAYAGLITVTGNKFYSEAYKPRIKKAIKAECVVVKDNYIKAGAVTAVGSFAFTMDGNLTDEAAFDALAFEAAKEYFYDVRNEVLYGEEKEYSGGLEFNDYLTTIFKIISDLLYFFFDGAGFGEM
jgi:hypothetical protein